jgi:hypothetical protein
VKIAYAPGTQPIVQAGQDTTNQRSGAMRYMLFTYRDPSVQLDAEQRAAVPPAVAAWCEEMDARGVRLDGHVLGPSTESRTIRARAGETMVADGPVSEQTVQIAGFNILECADLERPSKLPPRTRGRSSASWS